MEQQRQFGESSGQQQLQQYQPIQGSFSGIASQILGLQNRSAQYVRSIQGPYRNMTYPMFGLQTPYDQNVGSIQGSSRSIINPMFRWPMLHPYQYVGLMPYSSWGITPQMFAPQVLSGQIVPALPRYPMGWTGSQLIPTQTHSQPLLNSTGSSSDTAVQQTQSENNIRGFKVFPPLSDIPIISQKNQEPPSKKQRYQETSGLTSLPSVSAETVLQQKQQHDPMGIQPTVLQQRQQHDPMDIQRMGTNHGSGHIVGTCIQRLVDYTLKMQERPQDNNIEFWKNFVSEFFAEDAKMRWCVSSYPKKPKSVPKEEAWNCGLCQVKPSRGFEITADVMPTLCKIMHDNGTMIERYHLENPSEYKSASGLIVLQSSKVTHETLFLNRHVARKGLLCIVFTPDLKICTWEFCGQHHDEFIPRRDFALQTSDHSRTAKRYEDAKNKLKLPSQKTESSLRTTNSSSNQISKATTSIHTLGNQKQYARGLQMSEVINYMKDLTLYTGKTGSSPQESLALFATTFNMLSGNEHSVQQLQQLLEQPQSRPTVENVMIIGNSSPDVPYLHPTTWNDNQMNVQYFTGYEAPKDLLNLSGPSNLSVTTQASEAVAMPPSASNVSPMETCVQQGEASSLASLAAMLDIETDISSMPESSNDIQLDSPNSVAKFFEECVDNSEPGGPDMQTVGNANNNVNSTGVEMMMDSRSSRGKDVVVDNNPTTPDDFERQLLWFVEGKNAVNITDF